MQPRHGEAVAGLTEDRVLRRDIASYSLRKRRNLREGGTGVICAALDNATGYLLQFSIFNYRPATIFVIQSNYNLNVQSLRLYLYLFVRGVQKHLRGLGSNRLVATLRLRHPWVLF